MIQLKDTGNSSTSHRQPGYSRCFPGCGPGSILHRPLSPTHIALLLLPLPVPHIWQKDTQELPGEAETLQMPKDLDVLVWDVAQASSAVILSGSQD